MEPPSQYGLHERVARKILLEKNDTAIVAPVKKPRKRTVSDMQQPTLNEREEQFKQPLEFLMSYGEGRHAGKYKVSGIKYKAMQQKNGVPNMQHAVSGIVASFG